MIIILAHGICQDAEDKAIAVETANLVVTLGRLVRSNLRDYPVTTTTNTRAASSDPNPVIAAFNLATN